MAAMTIEMIVRTTIATCMPIQNGGSCTPDRLSSARLRYSMIAWRRAIATAWVRVSA